MIIIRTSQQSQTQESIGECTASRSAQTVPPCMTEEDINVAIRGQRRDHIKGVGHQITCVPSPSSTTASSSTNLPAPTLSQPDVIPEFVHHQIIRVLQSYHQYLQSYVSSVYLIFQLPLVPATSPFVPPQQGQPDDEHIDHDAVGPNNLGDSQFIYIYMTYIYIYIFSFRHLCVISQFYN